MTKNSKDNNKRNADSSKDLALDELALLMDREGLQEVDLSDGDFRIKLSRQEMVPVAAVSSRPATAQKKKSEKKEEIADPGGQPIKSPLSGVFYRAPSPQAAPFVKEGDFVSPEKTVCIVEAMKVLNQINAGLSGKIIKVCVENGKPIQVGQVLFLVDGES